MTFPPSCQRVFPIQHRYSHKIGQTSSPPLPRTISSHRNTYVLSSQRRMAAQGCLSVQTETLRQTAAVVLLLACALVAGASASEIFRPGGEGFSLIVLVVVADVVGLALQAAVGAPPLLGHMIVRGRFPHLSRFCPCHDSALALHCAFLPRYTDWPGSEECGSS